jgi:hypothetical protein
MITLTTHEFATRVAIEDHARRQLKIRKAKVTGIISVYYGASIDTLITLPYGVLRTLLRITHDMLCK